MTPRALTRWLVNGAWMAAGSRERARFQASLNRVAETQQQYLLDLLRRNAATRFGEQHAFARITSIAEYQQHVPLTPYESLKPLIDSIAHGEANVLTSEPVELFQPTSGSTGGTKLIPWTAGAAREFRRAIAPWIAALYQRKPALLSGTAYWSVSPPVTALKAHGRLRVGFAQDAEYLGFLGRKLFSLVSAVPADVSRCRDLQEFRARTLVSLLADTDLRLISVWSPTFLSTLLEHFLDHRQEILERLSDHRGLQARRRAEFLRSLFAGTAGTAVFEQVWPNLQILSCWTHGPSEIYAENLRRFFPTVEFQGKGLIATEAFVSLPFQEDLDPVLAVTSHFFEFQHAQSEEISLAHELEVGSEYRVIVTTGGGLYRYPLGDRVRVTGFLQETPCLRFLGRAGNVSDLFGEKLHGSVVENVIRKALSTQGVRPRFFLLAPAVDAAGKTAYALFLDAERIPNADRLRDELEEGLAKNFHYAHCRKLGQLSLPRLFLIQHDVVSPEAVFQQEMLSRGVKVGDIKPTPLDWNTGWDRRFHGQFVLPEVRQ